MKPDPVRMTLKWSVTAGEARSIAGTLQTLMIETRMAPGCLGCSSSFEMDQRASIRYVEEWKTEEELQHQIRSDRFARLAELMERSAERPSVEFVLPGGTLGLDYAEKVRSKDVAEP